MPNLFRHRLARAAEKFKIQNAEFKIRNAGGRIITIFSRLFAQDEAEAGGAIKNEQLAMSN